MQYDRQIVISTGSSRKTTSWKPEKLMLSELYARFGIPVRSTETVAEYMKMTKGRQDDLKDVGGFIGGELAGNKRKACNMKGRDIIVLDLDNIPPGGTDGILKRLNSLGCGYCVYSTRKHQPSAPRLRVIFPISRTVTTEEFEPIARKTAFYIQPEMTFFDRSTFEVSRLMYYPSVCSDSEYIYKYEDKPLLDADGLLKEYADWHDMTSWPQVPGTEKEQLRMAGKQADPTTKPGVVGAFCRVYNVYQVMDKFIKNTYEPCDNADNRYTFTGGSTSGGAVVYEDGKFLYSHHATDPAGGRLCNAFDLVRLHIFADLDNDAKPDTPANKLPSFNEMCKFAVADEGVRVLMNRERLQQAQSDFDGVHSEDDINWQDKLKRSETTNAILKTTDNMLIILDNDPLLKNRIATDDFAHKGAVLDTLPWDRVRTGRRFWDDNDDAGVRWYFENYYQITGKEKISDAISIHGRRHSFDEIKQYLDGLVWDSVPRLDSLFIDYLGADDNEYTRAVTRKAFTAAVARTYKPGIKFDIMTILSGPQGIGKSTILRKMGHSKWFTDGIKTFEGKEVCELIQGVWIVEIGELEALNKVDVNRVKQVLSQTVDRFRAAYGRHVQDCPRRCVFFGTSNNREYLRDKTGNRRFWPIDTGIIAPTKSVFRDLDDEVDMIWAEAKFRYQMGEQLCLTAELEEWAKSEQEMHREMSVREGLIREYIEKKVPREWSKWDLNKRQIYNSGGMANVEDKDLVERDRICALEIWCEVFGGDFKGMRYSDAAEINATIELIGGWERYKKPMRFGYCGVQKGFQKGVTLG